MGEDVGIGHLDVACAYHDIRCCSIYCIIDWLKSIASTCYAAQIVRMHNVVQYQIDHTHSCVILFALISSAPAGCKLTLGYRFIL